MSVVAAIQKPEFTEPLKDECVHEGKTVHLECRFTGEPPPQIQWMCNDVQILPSAMFQVPYCAGWIPPSATRAWPLSGMS